MDYAKKKNDELVALCKERGLPHTGKKADFVKRLEEYDAAQSTSSTKPAASAKPAIEDEIDWDDEPATETTKAATTEPAADAIAAGGVGEVKNPVAVPNQTLVEDPTTENELTVVNPSETTAANGDAATAEPEKEKSPEKDFSAGIAERTLDEEIEKRKARALKFGMLEDNDEIKQLERAKRFGIQEGSKVLGMLNQGLSEGRDRKRGLDAALGDDAKAGGVRKRGRDRGRDRGRPGMGGRRGSSRPRSSAPPAERKENGGGKGSWMSEEDKKKAEARKARFATAT